GGAACSPLSPLWERGAGGVRGCRLRAGAEKTDPRTCVRGSGTRHRSGAVTAGPPSRQGRGGGEGGRGGGGGDGAEHRGPRQPDVAPVGGDHRLGGHVDVVVEER